MLNSYQPQPWPAHIAPAVVHDNDDSSLPSYGGHAFPQLQFDFQFDFQKQQKQQFNAQKQRPVPAPAQPLIPDDNGHAFSHYIAHEPNPQLRSPSTPLSTSTYSGSSLSSGPFSAITPSSITSFPSFASSSYSELQGFDAYFPTGQSTPTRPPQLDPPVPESRKRPVVETAPAPPPDDAKVDPKRPTGACTRCKKMKMKCEFRPADPTCQRCKTGRFECVVEGRKPRTPSQREWLLSQIRQKDAMIATLLKAYRPVQATPINLAGGKINLSPDERSAHREALAWAEKGGPSAAAGQRWRVRYRERGHARDKAADKDRDEDSDEWSSGESAESEDAWDGEAAAAGKTIGAVYAHVLPDANAPFGMLARLSLEADREGEGAGTGSKRSAEALEAEAAKGSDREATADEEDEEWGIANRAYFQPGPSANLALRRVLNERESPPAIIASGLITWPEAEKLFEVFYKYINPYASVLDPVLHTCSSVFERCPFLFTVVCAISLRYHSPRPGLYKLAMHFAKTAAATAFVDGYKSVELVQGYFLLSMYGLPARSWEEDRSWFYGGLATRLAVDLGLNRLTAITTKPLSERHARELLNRVRTWLICFNVDRSSATQYGKPSGIHDEELVSQAKEWYRSSKYNHSYDLHLVMYLELLRIMSRFHEQVYAGGVFNKNCNFRAVTESTEAELRVWHDDITWRYENESDRNDPSCVFRTMGVPLFENYMRLVMYSFGFQDAWKRHGVEPGDMFFAKCLQAASAVVRQLVEVYASSGYFKYAPDCYFVMGGFCSAFLLKMLRPEFASLVDQEQRTRITTLVGRLVDVLASSDVAIDEAHTPKLYARFLHGQLRHVAETAAREAPPASPAEVLPEVQHATPSSTTLDAPPLFSHSTPGSHYSSSGSSVPTPGPEQDGTLQGWPDSWTEGSTTGSGSATAGVPDDAMDLCEEDYLATMQAVSNEQWVNSMLMPGFKWPMDTQVGFDFPGSEI